MPTEDCSTGSVQPVVAIKGINGKGFHHPANLESAKGGDDVVRAEPGRQRIIVSVVLINVRVPVPSPQG